nr:CDP-glycerol glycerophosphotransferase family protein [Lachnospiraceae bacterium]
DAFGPVIGDHDELVESLCKYMKNNCKTEEMYVQRADSFFAYKDHENCSRIFEAINRFVYKK